MIFRYLHYFACVFICVSINVYGQANKNNATKETVVSVLKEFEKRGLKINQNDNQLIATCLMVVNGRNDSIDQGLYRFLYYRDFIESKRRVSNLPWYITYLPLANTGANPLFKGKDGKSGMWPLGYTIGKKYGLIQNSLYDERRNFEKSTDAAIKYLQDLNNIYNDWNFSIMAFNVGGARLNQVIHFKKALSFDSIFPYFQDNEKQLYYNFIAHVCAFQIWDGDGISTTELQWVPMNQLKRIASSSFELPIGMLEEKTGITAELIKRYNPELKLDVIPYFGTKNSGIRPLFIQLPVAENNLFKLKQDSFSLWVEEWNLKVSKENNGIQPVGSINRHTGELIEKPITVNQITEAQAEPAPSVAVENPSVSEENQIIEAKTWVYYTIKRGDALYTMLDVFDCTESEVRNWNNIRKSQFMIAGQKLKFQVNSNKKQYYSKINGMTLVEKRELAKND